MNINQYKNIKSCFKILAEENKKSYYNCNHALRNHCVVLLEGFNEKIKDFDKIQNHILGELVNGARRIIAKKSYNVGLIHKDKSVSKIRIGDKQWV